LTWWRAAWRARTRVAMARGGRGRGADNEALRPPATVSSVVFVVVVLGCWASLAVEARRAAAPGHCAACRKTLSSCLEHRQGQSLEMSLARPRTSLCYPPRTSCVPTNRSRTSSNLERIKRVPLQFFEISAAAIPQLFCGGRRQFPRQRRTTGTQSAAGVLKQGPINQTTPLT
jgi:hypothetical protein